MKDTELDPTNQDHFHTSTSQCVEPTRKNRMKLWEAKHKSAMLLTRPSQLYKYLPLTTKNSFSLPSINFQVNRYSKLHTSLTHNSLSSNKSSQNLSKWAKVNFTCLHAPSRARANSTSRPALSRARDSSMSPLALSRVRVSCTSPRARSRAVVSCTCPPVL